MSTSSIPVIVGLGPISSEIVAPIFGSHFTYIENPTPQDLAIAEGALVRAAFEFNKSVFSIDDISLKFYNISRNSEKTRKKESPA